jgi:zinc/manganese transport system permease protein
MNQVVLFLWPPFVVAICLVGIHAYFGIQVLRRKVIFVDLALAQTAALGATVAFMLGHPAQSTATYSYSLVFTFLAAALLAFTRQWAGRVPQEAWIGVIYVIAAGAAVLLIDRAPQGAEHLKQVLTGNILTSGADELFIIIPLYAAVGTAHWLFRRHMDGGGSILWEFVFYATFGIVVTSSVSIAGVLLVFSFLIIPAAVGVLYADVARNQILIGWATGIVTSGAGLLLSFWLDFPTGATMVCGFGGSLVVAALAYPFLRGSHKTAAKTAVAAVRWTMSLGLFASALQFAIVPRADQPLLDTAEYLLPQVRNLYFKEHERRTFVDASVHADHYYLLAEQLNDKEKLSRSEGEVLDDTTVARISSFLKSYGEMRKGEQFVMAEVSGRARERIRWPAAAVLLAFALLAAPIGSRVAVTRWLVYLRSFCTREIFFSRWRSRNSYFL